MGTFWYGKRNNGMNNLSVLAIAAVALFSADSATANLDLPSAPKLPPGPN